MERVLSSLTQKRFPVPMVIDLATLTAVLYAIVAVMIIIVLYHLLFIMWDLRKMARRFEDLTSQVESVLLKPLSLADQGIQWVIEFIESKAKEHGKKKHHHKKVVDHETEESDIADSE